MIDRIGVLLGLFLWASAAPGQDATTILQGGTIWTGDSLQPYVEAVAVRDGRILAVGDREALAGYRGPQTRVVDLAGQFMMPGFIDDHAHFTAGGFQLQSVDLRDAETEEEFARRIGEHARGAPGRWITGGDWDHDRWPGGALPTRALVDSLTPKTPVFVSRYDGHMGLANSVALRLAGITAATPDPPGGTIVRDPRSGEPTGVLKDEAMGMVFSQIPPPTAAERLDAARRALAEARRCGVTSIQDISSWEDVVAYQDLKEQGELTARLYCRLPIGLWKELADQHIRAGTGDDWIVLGSLKAFADGSLGSSTALFFEPYDSDPGTRGLPSDIVIDGRLRSWARAADSCGLQLSIHAIGDSANHLILDLFEEIVRANPRWDRRFRIEHAQHLRRDDLDRFARLGVIASAQPYHAIDDGRWAEGRIGAARCRMAYPFRSFLDHGVRLAFGSDWTVAPLDPILGVYAAVTRRTTDGKNPGGWYPEEKITVEEALRAYTIAGAYAAFEEHKKGTIAPGKLADFTVLSEDPFRVDPSDLSRIDVVMTIVDGRLVYQR